MLTPLAKKEASMSYRLSKISCFILAMLTFALTNAAHSLDLGPVQVHGFLSQGYIYSSGNEYLQGSDKGGTFDFSNAAVNFLYRPTNKLFFAGQLISRNFGDAYANEKPIDIDYLFASANIIGSSTDDFTVNLGKIKTTYGIFNNSRNIPFTHVGIISDQTLYSEYDRHMTLYGTGISLDYKHRADIGDFRVIYQNAKISDDKRDALSTYPQIDPDSVTEFDGVDYSVVHFMLSPANTNLEFGYSHGRIDAEKMYILDTIPGVYDRHWSLNAINNIYSARYTTENFTLTAEYMNRVIRNKYRFIPKNIFPYQENDEIRKSDSAYIQGAYRFTYDLEGFVSYHFATEEINGVKNYGAPYNQYRRQWVVGADWDIFENTLLKAEFHMIDGTYDMIKEPGINQNGIDRKWNMFVMQLSYKF